MFPDEYLRHVNEKHTHYTIEMRHPDGIMLCQGDMHPRVYHHGSRDMASLYIGPETDIVEHYADNGLEIGLDLLSEKGSRYPLQVGQVCTICKTAATRALPSQYHPGYLPIFRN